MHITNVDIGRIITHDVVRATQVDQRPGFLSDQTIQLDQRGKELLGKRISSTFASGSHCVDVTVDEAGRGSPFELATSCLDLNDGAFVRYSQQLAQALSAAQTAGSIKAGSGIFVQGTLMVEAEQCRFIAIIKADSDQGFVKSVEDDNITLQFLNDMILGESQRLIKIALFIEETPPANRVRAAQHPPRDTGDFSIKVFDHNMQNSGDGNAATYFYNTFLRCRLAENAPRKTKQFFELTRDFINERDDLSPGEKLDLRGDLIAYLRGNREIVESRIFAREVLPRALQNDFVSHCRDEGIEGAIAKDLTLLKGKLRRQTVKFSSNVTVYASPEIFRDSVRILPEVEAGWTDLRIRGSVEEL